MRAAFALFHWVPSELLAARGDGLRAYFVDAFAAAARANGGTDPQLTDSVECAPEQMALLEIVPPHPDARLFRLSGYANREDE